MWLYDTTWGIFWVDAWQPVGNCLSLWGWSTEDGFQGEYVVVMMPRPASAGLSER